MAGALRKTMLYLGLADDRVEPDDYVEYEDQEATVANDFEAQVTEGRYTRAFRLTRNPVDKDGNTSAIVEEGRTHLEVSLVLSVSGDRKASCRERVLWYV